MKKCMTSRLGLFLAVALLPAFSLASSPVDVVSDGPQNWSAPPYWSPPAASPGEQGARSALATGRQALVTSPVPLPFVAITPCRQYDSRGGSLLADNTPRTVTLIGAPCAIPPDAQAVAVDITAFNIIATSNGVFRVGTVAPLTKAWINYPPTDTQRGNAGVLRLGAGGTIVVQINQGSGSVDFLVDVFGYYSPLGIVNHVNGLTGDVTLAAGANVSIAPSANTLTIDAAGATGPTGPQGPTGATGMSGSMVLGAPGDTTLIGAGYTEIAATPINLWTATTITGAPSGRWAHTAV
jgi:hypothetical protein